VRSNAKEAQPNPNQHFWDAGFLGFLGAKGWCRMGGAGHVPGQLKMIGISGSRDVLVVMLMLMVPPAIVNNKQIFDYCCTCAGHNDIYDYMRLYKAIALCVYLWAGTPICRH